MEEEKLQGAALAKIKETIKRNSPGESIKVTGTGAIQRDVIAQTETSLFIVMTDTKLWYIGYDFATGNSWSFKGRMQAFLAVLPMVGISFTIISAAAGYIFFSLIFFVVFSALTYFCYSFLYRKDKINKLGIYLNRVGVKDLGSIKKIDEENKFIFFSIWSNISLIKLKDNADKIIAYVGSKVSIYESK